MVKKQIINPRGVVQPAKSASRAPTWSNAVKVQANRFLFISGQVSWNEKGEVVYKGDIEGQARQALENMKKVLVAGRGRFEDIVKVTVFTTDIRYFSTIHKVRAEYFKKDPPASTLVHVSSLASPDLLVEIEAIAALD